MNICHSCGKLQSDEVGHSYSLVNGLTAWVCSRDCSEAMSECPTCGEPFDDPADMRHVVTKLEADARAIWAVRVLDARGLRWQCVDYHGPYAVDPSKRYRCEVGTQAAYEAETPDAARIAAAEALVAADPSLEP
jgi:hypothetical protein